MPCLLARFGELHIKNGNDVFIFVSPRRTLPMPAAATAAARARLLPGKQAGAAMAAPPARPANLTGGYADPSGIGRRHAPAKHCAVQASKQAPVFTSRRGLRSTSRPSVRRSTFSWGPRRRGSRSPTTEPSSRSRRTANRWRCSEPIARATASFLTVSPDLIPRPSRSRGSGRRGGAGAHRFPSRRDLDPFVTREAAAHPPRCTRSPNDRDQVIARGASGCRPTRKASLPWANAIRGRATGGGHP
jgi:hypothetical protein